MITAPTDLPVLQQLDTFRSIVGENFVFIDEEVLAAEGIADLEKYAVTPGGRLYNDLFL